MFGLGTLFYVIVLLLNAVSILHEERFIKRLFGSSEPTFGSPEDTFKSRVLTLIRSIRTVTRPVLITANIIIIGYELVLG